MKSIVLLSFVVLGLAAQNFTSKHQLADAVSVGNMRLAEELLVSGYNPDSVDSMGRSALAHAVSRGSFDMSEQLLKRGAPPDTVDAEGLNPLMIAVLVSNAGILELLLDYGAAPNYVSNFKQERLVRPVSALTMAVNRREFDMARILLRAGANPLVSHTTESRTDKTAVPGQSPPANGYIPPLNQGLRTPPAGQSPPANGYIPLESIGQELRLPAFENRIDASVWRAAGELMSKVNSPNWQSEAKPVKSRWLLHWAAKNDDWKTMRRVLGSGGSPDVLSASGVSPLMVAAWFGNRAMVYLLLQQGAEPDITDVQGRSVLCYAAAGGNLDIVSRIAGKNTAMSHSLLNSPFMYALVNGDSAMFKRLRDLDISTDVFDDYGVDLAMLAAWFGDDFAISSLLPDINVRKDIFGRNALAWAVSAFLSERETGRELQETYRSNAMYGLVRSLSALRALRVSVGSEIVEAWFESSVISPYWQNLRPSPVPKRRNDGDIRIYRILRDEEPL